MKKQRLFLQRVSVIFLSLSMIALLVRAEKTKENGDLNITKIELASPCAAIPYYHFTADIELAQPSIIEVEAAVDGKVLRATELRRASDFEDLNRPPISDRPPQGYIASQDGTHYKNLSVVGWVKWEPGQNYSIRISVRVKKSVHPAKDDILLSATKTVTAPLGVAVFDKKWKGYKSVIISETAGINRVNEPVEVLLAFYPDEAQQLTRDIRVMSDRKSTRLNSSH